jgi:uncharacterized iron-regulated membrane protein
VSPASISWRTLAGLVAAPVAWVVHHQLGADLNYADCRLGANPTLIAMGCVALIIAVAGGLVSWGGWKRAGGGPDTKQEPSGRFVAALAMMASGLFSLVILVQILAAVTLPACFK